MLMRKGNVGALTLTVLALVLPMLSGCHGGATEQSNPAPVVRVAKPDVREVTDYAYFIGRTDAVNSVEVRARVTGYLVSVDFESGSVVKDGQRLFKIDPRPYQAQLDQANGQIALNEAQLKLAQADLARAQEVAKTPGAISQQDLDTYAANAAEAAAALTAAKANAEVAALNLSFTDVISPIDGVAGRNLLTIGNLVTQDTTLLTTVVSEDPIYGYFNIDEHTLLRIERMLRDGKFKGVRDGAAVPVEMGVADEAKTYPHKGTIDFINNRVDPTTGTLEVRGVFENPKPEVGPRLLHPGMFLHVRLPLSQPYKALVVPGEALGEDQGNPYLLLVGAGDVVEYCPVTLGPELSGGWQVVLPVPVVRTDDGVRLAGADEQGEDSVTAESVVIMSGLQRIRAGAIVQTRPYEFSPSQMAARPTH